MDDKSNLKIIKEAIGDLPKDFSILEEQIDIELQTAYFEMAKGQRDEAVDELKIAQIKSDLYEPNVKVELKKQLLVQLAGLDRVDAFRIIEAYRKEASGEIKSWATLALQESKMIVQSSLLGEKQVFISTGLGGKGQSIRYFIAIINAYSDQEFNSIQQELIESELCYFLKKGDGELEEISFDKNFALGMFLFPLKSDIHEVLKLVIDECNQYGNFLSEEVMLTNVKKMSVNELNEFINKNKNGKE